MNRKITVFVVLLCLCLAISSVCAAISEWKLVVREKGTVESLFSGNEKWEAIWMSRKLKDGDKARTAAESRAKIRLSDQSVITLGEKTEVEMSQFKIQPESRLASIKLFFGKVRANVGRFEGKESKFEIKTPNAVLAARGTDFLVEYASFKEKGSQGIEKIPQFASSGAVAADIPLSADLFTRLIVFSKSVDITSLGKTVTVNEGNTAMVGADGIIHVTPTDFVIILSGEGARFDKDLYEHGVESFEAFGGGDVPRIPGEVTTPGTFPGQPGGIQPPPGNTGNITVIINPQ